MKRKRGIISAARWRNFRITREIDFIISSGAHPKMSESNNNNSPRVALIAGGSGAIGGASARRLAADGMRVFIGYSRNEETARGLAREIAAAGGAAEAIQLDVGDTAMIDAVCQGVFTRCGRLDVLVNSAALNIESPALALENEDWNAVIDANLSGAFRLARAAAKYMLLNRWGRIINISSIAAHFGGRGQANYAAAKAGLESLTRVLALELGRKGVLANCVAPGVIETRMSDRIRAEHGPRLLEAIAQGRFGRAGEVAEAVAFLAGERASYINGQVINVDGGMGL